MTTVQAALPDDLFSSMRMSPDEVAREMRLTLAVRWYGQGLISQGLGAELAGLPRESFLRALSAAGVSPFQETGDDIPNLLGRG